MSLIITEHYQLAKALCRARIFYARHPYPTDWFALPIIYWSTERLAVAVQNGIFGILMPINHMYSQ